MNFIKFSWVTLWTGFIAYLIEVFFIDFLHYKAWFVIGIVMCLFTVIKYKILFPEKEEYYNAGQACFNCKLMHIWEYPDGMKINYCSLTNESFDNGYQEELIGRRCNKYVRKG
jgi:hypothetical protein